jgi:hypothetical protein
MMVKGHGIDNGINDANLANTAAASIVFNLSQQNAPHTSSRFRPNNVEPRRPSASVRSENCEAQYLAVFIYRNIVPPTLLKVAIKMGSAFHNVFHVLKNCVFDRVVDGPLASRPLHYRVVH